MRASEILRIALVVLLACDPGGGLEATQPSAVIGGGADPAPTLTFTQVAKPVGIDRSNEPPSAGAFTSSDTLAYGGWLADLDGDGRLDYFGVNHGQWPHLSGLFVNNGAGGFGKNLFTVSFQLSDDSYPNLGLSNELRFVGDLTGDGRVDLYFAGWSGQGVMCVNQGVSPHADWTGPSFLCFGTTDGLAFADVNGDGKIDVLTLDSTDFDAYTAYYSHTATYLWRLNNGDPNIQNWPTTRDFLGLRVTDPGAVAAPFVDLDNDGIPDKIVGIPRPPDDRGPYATATAGHQVFLGQAGGAYALKTGTGLEGVTEPITRIEDVNDDGCLDIGTDATGYRDNQNWYVQNKAGTTCTVTFTPIPRTALPCYPGFKRYDVDLDNSGLLSRVVIIHSAYGHNDARPGGVSICRRSPDGTFTVITPAQSGIDVNGADEVEFYAPNLSPGDWDDDGRIDLAGSGNASIPDTDHGFALWTSALVTTNSWIKVTLPSVTGFFRGSATIEVFDSGFVGEATRLVTPPRVLFPGRAWASQVYHFGIGTRSSVDVRVTFPDGGQTTRTGVARRSRIAVEPPTAVPAFIDVPSTHIFRPWIEALLRAGITAGCGTNPPIYCPDQTVSRAQLAVFLLRGIHGAGYQPPDARGVFADVPIDHAFVTWTEQLFAEGITAGCGANPLRYCPDDGVTRGQMAVLLLRSRHGVGYQPPAPTGTFADVPAGHPFRGWIEQLSREGITAGCGTTPARYCPDDPVTRGQMAVFLARVFGLP